ncbi:Multivesicular body subunit 12A ESCRT-I complex subunit MVB12A [Triplophysa tibetana]|uniref:Multivesicular body subunit 12A n=1 Tax=Triplophysa tibetana TaxID=1572043 RepID=A0A5A9PLN9_9TELE|nr:Multivesicular body subunit 12A ESCRT-I complex subunit MVB12A [Triplophysa tibetana]
MSVLEASSRPITAVAWASNTSSCPSQFSLINQTEDGGSANFSRGFGLKSGYYLCYSRDLSGGMVVADVLVISDKETIPHGYCYIPEYLEHKASIGKKKRICVRIVPVGSVTTAVLELKLTVKNKTMLQQYTCLGDMNGFVVWCLKGVLSPPTPQAKPRRVSLDMRSLTLEGSGPPQPLKPSNPPAGSTKFSRRRTTLETSKTLEGVCDSGNHSNISGITAMDGVPFSLHPKFECQTNPQVSVSTLSDIRIKSVQDIENEYNYMFAVEELAAKRMNPF